MIQDLQMANSQQGIPVGEFLLWALIALLGMLLLALLIRLFNKSRKGNAVFYEKKGAINLRIKQVPDLRIATKHCKDFHMEIHGKRLTLSYANPFGQKKEFKCKLVGENTKHDLLLTFNEKEFRKLCMNLKPGKMAISKTQVLLNYNRTIKVRSYKKLRKEETL